MLGAQPAGAYGWLPTCAGLLLFLMGRCDAGPGAVMRAVSGGKSLNVGNALRKSVVEKKKINKTLEEAAGEGPFHQAAVLLQG